MYIPTNNVTRCWNEKVAQMLKKLTQMQPKQFFLTDGVFFKIAQKVTKYPGFFGKKICFQELLTITQYGPTSHFLPTD